MENTHPSLGYYLLTWLISALALLITSKVIPGFKVKSFGSALWAAVVIGIANTLIWPILIFLTLPINLITLGLFTFVVNGAVLKICAAMMKGFDITNWWSAIFGAIVLALVGMLLRMIIL
ncbi:MAG: phage holin family protein [Cryobacterium sp.]|nr:phage holin family protein [Oligoflexia bacterium]